MRRARVLLVDDSAFVRRAVQRMLAALPEVQVVGHAVGGHQAVELVHALRPDLVILDVDMPGMDGLQALEQIMAERPTPVLLFSSHAQAGAGPTLRALEAGAVDFLDKSGAGSTMAIHELAPALTEKVRGILAAEHPLGARTAARAPSPPPAAVEAPSGAAAADAVRPGRTRAVEVVAIGASTGGPRALAELIPALPAGLGAAVVVAQHMPPGFTAAMAERLGQRSALAVREARDGERLRPGEVLVAPGGRQLALRRNGDGLRAHLFDDAAQPYRPSVDLLFASVAEHVGARAVGVVLTGMGRDGAAGLAAIRRAGGRALAESAESAVIDGMPAAARAHAEHVLPLPAMANAVAALCRGEEPR